MNPLARPKPGAPMDETIVYPVAGHPRPDSDGDGPLAEEHAPMPSPEREHTSPSGGGRPGERYYFGSGDRPLDGYTIKRAIGRGGFGEVYYAVSDAGKEVALKLLLRNVEIEKRGVQQCMNLKSPHLITIFDMKTTEEADTFVVMEYVSGPSLAQILERHPDGLPPHEVRMWLKGLVDGVAYLHDHGIVHRDLKPANLFLEEGTVKIGDYGLSKFIANSAEAGHSASVGTCHYMAPEISTGKYQKPIDIYAIGVILYEMLTGRVPFEGETPHEVLMKHLTSRPDLSPLAEPYREIVSRALAKDPARRPQSAFELLVPQDAPRPLDVRFIGDGKSSPASPAPPPVPTPGPEPEPKPKAKSMREEEEILHIGEEDSVLYIGPDTMPPRRPGVRGWLRPRANRQARRPSNPRPPIRQASARRPAPASAAATATARRASPSGPPPTPPPLPPARIRLAEATTSMLVAAPVAAALAVIAAALLGDREFEPLGAEVAVLLGTALIGAWSLLVPTKFWEGRQVDSTTRRFTLGAVGLAFGALTTVVLGWTNFDLASVSWYAEGAPVGQLVSELVRDDAGRLQALGLPLFYGLAFALGPWCRTTARDRQSRVRIAPVFWAGVVGILFGNLTPAPLPWAPASLVLMAITLQLISPRSEQAARFARVRRSQAA
ncbi:serine/threonine-protein kinase [Tautonia sociabilis]|nr:serine/threonine-protein kinase [Tautonia sociabilis]